jgi:hypothetical protein
MDARGAEKNDRVANALASQVRERLEVLGHDPERTRVRTLEKRLVLVSEERT